MQFTNLKWVLAIINQLSLNMNYCKEIQKMRSVGG